MTSKCKTCGHEEKTHKGVTRPYCYKILKDHSQCKCEKFQPEDVCHVEGCLGAPHHIMINSKQKKGSSEEKVWKDYLNNVKKKQKKGCGCRINVGNRKGKCGDTMFCSQCVFGGYLR